MDAISSIAAALGLAWASGIRLYVALFVTGLLTRFGHVDLPPALNVLGHPLVLTVAGLMLIAEFLVDKIPGFDTAWDAVHTFIRVPAGAILAAGALGTMDPAYVLATAIAGGMIATTSHATKTTGRALINTSPEPFSNWTASFAEDLIAPAGLAIAFKFPLLFLCILGLFLILAIVLMRLLWRTLKNLIRRRRPARA